MKKLSIILLLGLSLTLITGCSPTGNTLTSSNQSTTASKEEKITISVKITDNTKEVSNKNVKITEGTSLMDLMKKEHKLEEKNGMITAIDGLKQDEQAGYYWTYTINGEWATKGAQETFVKNGDQVEFDYGKVE
ncbi:DUF4430 domain-containing protein [Candidatus Enterococcus ferrettii]|uniref:Transcobalamin-like C-terminal domain-containing protein n=1 Tax=Candidatus Enterococcus ferrettii TaxID=2815324 RepID=A0ABV0EUA9_9ENTE|nr:DUF4430 domain-containing protein [Enterococcus sp. 665A]MBO1339468.1 DUF4430 domain-containing protein [Enterococcus sp. 665A]